MTRPNVEMNWPKLFKYLADKYGSRRFLLTVATFIVTALQDSGAVGESSWTAKLLVMAGAAIAFITSDTVDKVSKNKVEVLSEAIKKSEPGA